MAHPYHAGPPALPAIPSWAQPQIPPGYGCLVATFNRGPYAFSVMRTSRLKVSGHEVPGLSEGTWVIPVLAGEREVKVVDPFGMPIIKTTLAVYPGAFHTLSFRFGGWRNRVHDGAGTDVTRFGLWSNYLIMLVTLGVLLPLVCGVCVGAIALSS